LKIQQKYGTTTENLRNIYGTNTQHIRNKLHTIRKTKKNKYRNIPKYDKHTKNIRKQDVTQTTQIHYKYRKCTKHIENIQSKYGQIRENQCAMNMCYVLFAFRKPNFPCFVFINYLCSVRCRGRTLFEQGRVLFKLNVKLRRKDYCDF
jgi:hypothetical protein